MTVPNQIDWRERSRKAREAGSYAPVKDIPTPMAPQATAPVVPVAQATAKLPPLVKERPQQSLPEPVVPPDADTLAEPRVNPIELAQKIKAKRSI